MKTSPEIITFYGADGCGKSSVARNLSRLMTNDGQDNMLLGSSSYKEWLNEDVSRLVFGDPEHILALEDDEKDKTLLYGDIAVACYGLSLWLKQQGVSAVIDSDPLFKRVIWSSLELDEQGHVEYAKTFNQRFSQFLGKNSGPDTIVAINQGKDSRVSASDLVKRILLRGNPTFDDPTRVDAMVRLMDAVGLVWCEVEKVANGGQSKFPMFTDRLGGARIIHASNPDCTLNEDIVRATNNLATEILESIKSPRTT